jgi:hypothetical protein
MKPVISYFTWGFLILMVTSHTFGQEIRLGINYERSILPKLEIDGKAQLRKIIEQPHSWYSIVQAGLAYEFLKRVTVSGAVRSYTAFHVHDEILNDEINEKLRYTADLKVKTGRLSNGLEIRNRLRYQHSAFLEDGDKNYIRDKLSIHYKLSEGMQPVIAFEPFFLIDDRKIRKIRIYMGSEFAMLNNELELCFIIEGRRRNGIKTVAYKAGIYFTF